jgi:CBS-domain-containing membrane protein
MRSDTVLVRDIMRTEFYAFNINSTLASACESMNNYKLYGAPVVDDEGYLRGVFTRPHLIRALIDNRDENTLLQCFIPCSKGIINTPKNYSKYNRAKKQTQPESIGWFSSNSEILQLQPRLPTQLFNTS